MSCKLLALALLAGAQAGLVFAQPVIQAVPERPRIIVDGYGEVKTPPNLAIIAFTVRGEGSSSDDAVRAMTAQGARIEGALRKIDAIAEPLTGDVKVTPGSGATIARRRIPARRSCRQAHVPFLGMWPPSR